VDDVTNISYKGIRNGYIKMETTDVTAKQ